MHKLFILLTSYIPLLKDNNYVILFLCQKEIINQKPEKEPKLTGLELECLVQVVAMLLNDAVQKKELN